MSFSLTNDLNDADKAFFYLTIYQSALDNGMATRSEDPDQGLKDFQKDIEEYNHSKQDYALFVAKDDQTGQYAGIIWLADRGGPSNFGLVPTPAWVYDIAVLPEFRRRGLGQQLLSAGETWAYGHGYSHLGLHVFGYNQNAINLYYKHGFKLNSCYLQKEINGAVETPPTFTLHPVTDDQAEQAYKLLSRSRMAQMSSNPLPEEELERTHTSYLERFGFKQEKHQIMLVEKGKDETVGGLWFYKSKGDMGDKFYVWAQEAIGTDAGTTLALYAYLEDWAQKNDATAIRTLCHASEEEIITGLLDREYQMANLFMLKPTK